MINLRKLSLGEIDGGVGALRNSTEGLSGAVNSAGDRNKNTLLAALSEQNNAGTKASRSNRSRE